VSLSPSSVTASSSPGNELSLPSATELFIADYLGIRTETVSRESRAWSHTSYTDQSLILQITAKIEEQGGKEVASKDLIAARRNLFHALIRHDQGAYVRAATAVGGLIERDDLPNVQLVLHPSRSLSDLAPQPVDSALVGREGQKESAGDELESLLVPDCTLANVTFAENALDKALLFLFRSLVQRETGYKSPKEGILGLLEVCRLACAMVCCVLCACPVWCGFQRLKPNGSTCRRGGSTCCGLGRLQKRRTRWCTTLYPRF
jgi:hypothetical protein